MPRKSKPIEEMTPTEILAAKKRIRNQMNTARIVRLDSDNNLSQFVVLHNGKVTAMFGYDTVAHEFAYLPNTMGNYDGFPRWYRANSEQFANILISKSPDEDVIAAQTDRFVAEKFITDYLDRKETRERLALKAAEQEGQYTPSNGDNINEISA